MKLLLLLTSAWLIIDIIKFISSITRGRKVRIYDFSLENTLPLRGVLALLIALHHVSQRIVNTYSLGILKVGRIHCCLILLYYGIWPYYFIRKKRNIISGRIFQAPHYKINFALYNLYHWLHIILVAEGSKVQYHHQPKKFRC